MKVLLVEDERRLAGVVKDGLVAEGFVVDIVSDGISGLWAATENTYDAVVLDIMLPGLNGYDVLKQMRQRKIWTPVLMLTAKDGDYDQTDAFDLGADDYLTKPFSFMILMARLRALVRRGAPERPVLITAGTLVLDPARRVVARGGVPIPLTAREYGLLLFLMRHAGDVVSKAQILDNVWDSAYEGSDNIVEVYIGYLRKKLDAPFNLNTLRTVRGLGYRLDSDLPSRQPADRRRATRRRSHTRGPDDRRLGPELERTHHNSRLDCGVTVPSSCRSPPSNRCLRHLYARRHDPPRLRLPAGTRDPRQRPGATRAPHREPTGRRTSPHSTRPNPPTRPAHIGRCCAGHHRRRRRTARARTDRSERWGL